MMFEMIDPARHLELATVDEADDRARLIAAELYLGQAVITVGHTLVDGKRLAALEFDDIAKDRKPGAGQGLYDESISHQYYRIA
jgi:uncharacterized membrane protein YqjE